MLRMVLDQGYWPDTGLTAPDDEALRRDVELAKAMGFNGVRKHQKLEDPRYLYWADRLGLLVWEEMPSAYRFTRRVGGARRHGNGPRRSSATTAIRASWRGCRSTNRGACRTCPTNPAERHYVAGAVSPDEDARSDPPGHRQRRLGKRRDRHHRHPRLRRRSRAHRAALPRRRACCPGSSNANVRAGALLVLEGQPHAEQPIVLTEFGGIALSQERQRHVGLLARARPARRSPRKYSELMDAVHALGMLCGFCYTQFADTYQEANGLLYADRTPKFPIEGDRARPRAGEPQTESREPAATRAAAAGARDDRRASGVDVQAQR